MTLGLAVAFVVIWLRPDWLSRLGANTANPPDPELSMLNLIPDAVASAAPAVVNIYTTRAINPGNLRPLSRFRLRGNSGADTPPMVTSLGSGVVIDPAGFIATNHHVVAASRDIKVQLADGRVAQAQTIGTDTDTDLALLKIDLDDLPSMPLGRSDQIRIGEIVLAIGNPYGLSQTVTQGIVSATGRTELGVTRFENFIQTGRGYQCRQFRWSPRQPAGRTNWHQYRSPWHRLQYRGNQLRDPFKYGQGGCRRAQNSRSSSARLARCCPQRPVQPQSC